MTTTAASVPRTRGAGAALALVASAVSLAGCGGWAHFTPAGDVPTRPPKQPQEVKLYFDLDEPRCKYRVVGLYQSGSNQPSGDSGVAAMQIEPIREDAARRGFDGVMGLGCAAPGTRGSAQGNCAAKAYVCE